MDGASRNRPNKHMATKNAVALFIESQITDI